jgi:prevent-host-death family protein
MKPVNVHEAESHVSQLIKRVTAGEEIVIARNGKPVVKLVPLPAEKLHRRVPASMRAQIQVADDVDDPLSPELQKYIDGEE